MTSGRVGLLHVLLSGMSKFPSLILKQPSVGLSDENTDRQTDRQTDIQTERNKYLKTRKDRLAESRKDRMTK